MLVHPEIQAEPGRTVEQISNPCSSPPSVDGWTPGRFLVALTAVVCVLYSKLLLGLHTLFYRDYGVLGYPFVQFHRDSLWRVEWPMWNPLSNCGAPFLAQWGTMTLYPFSLVYVLLPMPWSLSLFCLGHLVLGGLGMYWLARRWTHHGFAAAVAGFAFVFNGVTLSSLSWPNYTVALGWLPWVLYFAERGGREGGRFIILGSVTAALQLLSGVPEIVLFTWLATGSLLFLEACRRREGRARLIFRIGGLVILAAGLASAQLFPFFDLLAHSQRDRFFATDKWSMPTWGWANFVVPLFHFAMSNHGVMFQMNQSFLSTYYMGLPVTVLALGALVMARSSKVFMLGGLMLFAMVMALGPSGHLYNWVRDTIPVMGIGRYAVKFIFLAVLALPLMAAYQLAVMAKGGDESMIIKSHRLMVAMGAVLVVLAGIILWFAYYHPFPYDRWTLTWKNAVVRFLFLAIGMALLIASGRTNAPARRLWLQIGFCLVLVLDVSSHLPKLNPTLPSYVMAPGVWEEVQESAPPRLGESRLMISPEAEKTLLRSPIQDLEKDFMGKRLAEWSNLNLLDDIPKINGSSTLQLKQQAEVQNLIYKSTNPPAPALIDFLGASVASDPQSVVDWVNRSTHLPWITCGQSPRFADEGEILAALNSEAFHPLETVYLSPADETLVAGVEPGRCRIITSSVSHQEARMTVHAEAPSLVVISQSFYHPWRALSQAGPLPLLRANHAFQAVVVQAGEHEIRLVYHDTRFHLGLTLSGLSLLGCGLLWWRWS